MRSSLLPAAMTEQDISGRSGRLSGTVTAAARPGTACVGCNKRKVRCSRDRNGCSNCLKADLPCVYTVAEPSKKRGPYKRRRPARQRHLEDLLRYLEPQALTAHATTDRTVSTGEGLGSGSEVDRRQATEDLVRDALIALTSNSAPDPEEQSAGSDVVRDAEVLHPRLSLSITNTIGLPQRTLLHPTTEQVFDLWQTFTTRVDPLTKIIHCRSVGSRLTSAICNPLAQRSIATETLILAIYFCAITASEPQEIRTKFGEDQHTLLIRYGRAIEAALADRSEPSSLETLQALVLYILASRRRELGANLRSLFLLAVSLAQILKVDTDPKYVKCTPFEAEMRRRAWWQLCSLESRSAEEGEARSSSITEACEVDLPSNLNDEDLDPKAVEIPVPRCGITDMTFVLIRLRNMHLVFKCRMIRKIYAEKHDVCRGPPTLEQNALFESHQKLLEQQFYRHMDDTRPIDWLCLKVSRSMLLKARMIIDHPFGNVMTNSMSESDRVKVLRNSVEVLSHTQGLEGEQRVKHWRWFWRGYTQWHALAIVVTELSQSDNAQFAREAWLVLDQVLCGWSKMYSNKRGEPAWDHVNTLLQLAKQRRAKQEQMLQVNVVGKRTVQSDVVQLHTSTLTPFDTKSNSSSSIVPESQSLLARGPTRPYLLSTYDRSVLPPPPPTQPLEAPTRNDAGIRNGDLDCGSLTLATDSNMEPETMIANGIGDLRSVDGLEDMLHDIDFDAFGTVFADEFWDLARTDDADPSFQGQMY
nr:bikaverin cluster transcription factor bik5 [Quercus suber]